MLNTIDTDNPLGLKLNEVMAEKGIAGDYAALARAFEVTTPSARDWIKNGRMATKRYQALVDWSGRSLHWWFDIHGPGPGGPALFTGDSDVRPWGALAWPFLSFSAAEIQRLPDGARREIEAFVRGVLSQHMPIKSRGA